MPTKEAINDFIEKQLTQLLRQLKEAKISEAKWGPYAWQSEFESLNEGIKALENIQFSSIDSFESVKELMEIEQFFKGSSTLNYFHFPNYRSFIDPLLLTHVKIDVQLDTLEMKALDLSYRGHQLAATEVKSLVFNLHNLNRWYFSEGKIDYVDYKTRALQAIDESRPSLEQHRGYKKTLGNLILLILTVGTAFLIHKACTGDFFFFKQTESAKQINALNQTINTFFLPQQSH
jgi:hypothetical protein